MGQYRKFLPFLLASFGRAPWETGIVPPEVSAYVAGHARGRALDLGCGSGTSAVALAAHGWDVVGVDFNPVSILRARRRAKAAGVNARFLVRPVTDLHGVPGPFDLVLDIGCYHTLAEPERVRYRAQLRSLLAPRGTFLVYGFLRDGSPAAPLGIDVRDRYALDTFLQLEEEQRGDDSGRPSAWLRFLGR